MSFVVVKRKKNGDKKITPEKTLLVIENYMLERRTLSLISREYVNDNCLLINGDYICDDDDDEFHYYYYDDEYHIVIIVFFFFNKAFNCACSINNKLHPQII